MRIAAIHQFTSKKFWGGKSERQLIENRYSPDAPKADKLNFFYGLAAIGSLSCQCSFGFEGRTSVLADGVDVRHLITHVRCANFVPTMIAHYLRNKIVTTCRMG